MILRPTIIFFFVVASLQLSAQSRLRNGRYHQKYGAMEVTGTVVNHEFHGTFVTKSLCRFENKLHPGWVITQITTYAMGKKNGPSISFDCNGDTLQVGNYCNGRMCGTWRSKYGRRLISICNYDQDGNFSGWQLYFNSDNNLYKREYYHGINEWYSWHYSEEGRLTLVGDNSERGREGTWYEYSNAPRLTAQDTFPVQITNWERGIQLGSFQKFSKGVITEEYEVVNSTMCGKHRMYRNGKLWLEETRINNNLHGPYKLYALNGNVYQSTNYSNGQPHGMCCYYDTITNQKVWQTEFENGVELSESRWTASGQLVYTKKVISKDSLLFSYEAYHPNGAMKERGLLHGKSVTGRFESWHENGRRFMKTTVVNDHWEDFMYIWNEQGIQVYSASVHQGISCDDEVVRSDKGIILKRGTKEYTEQVSKYTPNGLFSFEEHGYTLPMVTIAKRYPYLRNQIAKAPDSVAQATCVSANSPQFPGGEVGRVKFLQSNIRYPDFDLEAGVQGTTYIEFTVRADSSIADLKILREISPSTSKEVGRVVKMMPKWIPAKQNGKAVDQKCVMGVRFLIL